MAGRLTRFLNLEKRRTAPEPPAHEVVTRARFAPGGPPELVLEMDEGRQPFVRCPACEGDNNLGAERCFNCQQALGTDEVRAWNAAYWTRRQRDEALLPGSVPVSVPSSDEERHLTEALAREAGERERLRVEGSGGMYDPTPIALRILRSIEDGTTRLAVSLGLASVFGGATAVAYFASPHSRWRAGALCVAAALVAAFTPSYRRRRWW